MANTSIKNAFERMWAHVMTKLGEKADNITTEEIVQMFIDMDVVQPISDENNVVYTDTDGKAFIL
jgi:hypothetical protein